MPKKETVLRNVSILSAYLLVVWGLYRFFFQLPEEIEELFIKPIVWLLPVAYLVRKEKANLESIGITLKNLFPSIYLSLLLGAERKSDKAPKQPRGKPRGCLHF